MSGLACRHTRRRILSSTSFLCACSESSVMVPAICIRLYLLRRAMNVTPLKFVLPALVLAVGLFRQLPKMSPGRSPHRRSPSSSISPRSTPLPTRAPTSTSTPAETGGRTIRFPATRRVGERFNELAEYNNYLLYSELKAAADAPKTPLQKKYGDYFAACMNTALADRLAAKPIEPILKQIAEWNDRKKLATLFGETENKYAIGYLFNFGSDQDQKDSSKQIGEVDQAGLGLPDRDYYLNQDERSKKLRDAVCGARDEDVHAARRHSRAGGEGGQERACDRDCAGRGFDGARRSPQSDECLPHHDHRRAAGA